MSGFALSESYGLGRGFQSVVRGVTPAAGAGFSLTIDPRWRWRLLSAVFTLTADANAANRYVTIEYQEDDGVPFAVDAAAVVVTANSTQRFVGQFYRGVAEWAANADVLFPLTPLYLDGGTLLKISVAAIQATDQLSAIRFVFDRFQTGGEPYTQADR